jgi:PAS domain S-box-containing protein
MAYLLNHELRPASSTTREGHLLFTLDLVGNIKFANPDAERLLGYSCEEICRLNITQVAAPEFADYVRKQISLAVNGRVGAVYEIEFITNDRRRVALEISTHLVTRNGRPFELQGIAFPRLHAAAQPSDSRPRCLDERFTF